MRCPVCHHEPHTRKCPTLCAVFERERRPGRPRGSRDPRLSLDESRALLRALGDGPTAIAARLGVTRQAVDRALRVGLTVRMARRWGLVASGATVEGPENS